MLNVSVETLDVLQHHFHAVIRGRAGELVDQLDLPELASLPTAKQRAWFPIPGMYGGFSYWLERDEEEVKLMVESWSRISEGSG
ncbi:MAG: hypothetical protein WD294_04795 [Phycisphaeraceae bacterium]